MQDLIDNFYLFARGQIDQKYYDKFDKKANLLDIICYIVAKFSDRAFTKICDRTLQLILYGDATTCSEFYSLDDLLDMWEDKMRREGKNMSKLSDKNAWDTFLSLLEIKLNSILG
jgi:hypothetical protein